MTLPNFFIIGAARAGTTSLNKYLSEHPEVFMSPEKEPCFFSPDVTALRNHPKDCLHAKNYVNSRVTDFRAYQELFRGAEGKAAVGEASVSYLYSGEAPLLIKQKIAQPRFIVSLRNPVDRAFSSFRLKVVSKNESVVTFKKAVRLERARIRKHYFFGYYYIAYGFYFRHLKRYFDLYPSESIHVLLYEDLKENPGDTMKKIYRFLNIDDTIARTEYPVLSRGATLPPGPAGPLPLTKRLMKAVGLLPAPDLEVPQSMRRKLKTLYRDDILSLQNLISRDLSAWL